MAKSLLSRARICRTGGGAYDPQDRYIYFMASSPDMLSKIGEGAYDKLVAVNELMREDVSLIDRLLAMPGRLFLDSGVFSLASEHARTTGISHDEALKTPIHEIGGFQELYDKYVDLVRKNEKRLWGYVEIDLGGKDQKRETRAGLERLGLRPIPVYHPLNDGWDYFDELAQRYDRICVGNVVQASRYVRLRIMATIWHRKQQYPHLWVHLLGMTPNEWANAYPVESMDSSSWLHSLRWAPSWPERTALKPVSRFSGKYFYALGENEAHTRAVRLAAKQYSLNARNWKRYVMERYPPSTGARK